MGSICSQGIMDKNASSKQDNKKNKRIYLCNDDGECKSSLCMRGVPDDRPVLSANTMELLIFSWGVIKKDIERVGVVMFMGLLEEDEIKKTFRDFKHMTMEELRFSTALRSHVLRVMGIVDKLVARLDTPDKMIALLHELGQTHLKLNARPEYLDLVGPQFNIAIRPAMGDQWTPEIEQAWADMFQYITYAMRETLVM